MAIMSQNMFGFADVDWDKMAANVTNDVDVNRMFWVSNNHVEYAADTTMFDPDLTLQVCLKSTFKTYCEKYPQYADTWKLQLKLNDDDYEQTLVYVMDFIQQENKAKATT